MAESVDLIFADFVPDRGGAPWPENPGYLIDAVNVRFTPNGYRSTYLEQNDSETATAVGATPVAAAGFANITTPRHYVGTASKLYESSDGGGTWNDNSSAAYTATDWDFAIHGTTIIAVNIADNPQEKDLGDPVGTNFSDLGGTPPKAAHVARVRESLVLGQTIADSYGVRWSSIGDPTDWPTPGSATALARQAGSYSLPSEYGFVIQIVGGEKFGLVFQERAITRMTYVGGDIQFTFDVFGKGYGSGFPRSAIRVGDIFYYISSTGIWSTNGYVVTPVSLGKVEEAVIRRLLSYPNAATGLYRGVAYDHRINSICWAFIASDSTYHLLCYDLVLQQFKIVALAGSIIDGTLYSVHDGGSIEGAFTVPRCIDSNQKLRTFTLLTDIPTRMRTGFVELIPGRRSEICGIEVLGAKVSKSPQISVRSQDDVADIDLLATGYEMATKTRLTDQFQVRTSGRFHSFQYVDPAQAQGALVRGLRVFFNEKSER